MSTVEEKANAVAVADNDQLNINEKFNCLIKKIEQNKENQNEANKG